MTDARSLKLNQIIEVGRKLGGFGVNYAVVPKAELLKMLATKWDCEKLVEALIAVTGTADYDWTSVLRDSPFEVKPEQTEVKTPEAEVKEGEKVDEVKVTRPESNVEAAIRELVAASQPKAAGIDEDAVKSLIASELAKLPPPAEREVKVIFNSENKELSRVAGHTHKMFDKVLRQLGCGNNVMLKGPAGCGKTHLAAQVAEALGKAFTAVSCSGGVSESVFEGYLLPTGEGGRFEYQASPFAAAYEAPNQLILVDEFDAADANMALILNTALANGYMNIPKRVALGKGVDTCIRKGEGTLILVTANTFGNGPDAIYVGRNQMDKATLDRFLVMPIDYDKALENGMAAAGIKAGIEDARDIVHEIHRIRQAAEKAGLKEIVGTRMIQQALRSRTTDFTWDEIKGYLFGSWSANSRAAVGL